MRAGTPIVFFLYRVLLHPLVVAGATIIALFHRKVRRTLSGRRDPGQQLAPAPRTAAYRVIIHAASVGEFEQARPIIQELHRQLADLWVGGTFSSISGYDGCRDAPELNAAGMLPLDTRRRMEDFFDRIRPDLVIVVRYDLWLEMSAQALHRSIPVTLVCGTMRADSTRFKWPLRTLLGAPYRSLSLATVATISDAGALGRLAPNIDIVVCGDTRYDRVLTRAQEHFVWPIEVPVRDRRMVIIAGSTWPRDIAILSALASVGDYRFVIVPHEPTEETVLDAKRHFPDAVRLSQCHGVWPDGTLIIDVSGMLSAVYRIGDIAWVGGGFGAGVHSVLEPAAYGIPVFCGPAIGRSRDATAMHERGLLIVVRDKASLQSEISRLAGDPDMRIQRGNHLAEFVRSGAGATRRTVQAMTERGLLPSMTDNLEPRT